MTVKSPEEIRAMREGGRKLARILSVLADQVHQGITTMELEEKALEMIAAEDGQPSFKTVPGYRFASCITLNEEVVHGLPSKRLIKKGDLVSLDLGFYWRGFHTDCATSLVVDGDKKKEEFLQAGRLALKKAISQAKVGNRVGHLSFAIQEEITKKGFCPIRQLTGHGIGRKLHEDPSIPCFLQGSLEKTVKLKEGMTLAIEVIYASGPVELVLASDGWTIKAENGKITGLFEKTIAITRKGPLILT